MQRKLSEIAEIPRILSSTLATVSQTFDKLMPEGINDRHEIPNLVKQNRKYSYDEDAIDYELNDAADNDRDYAVRAVETSANEKHDNDENADDRDDDDDDDAEDDDEYDNEEVVVYTVCEDLHKLTLRAAAKVRDLTPESDYASSESDNEDEDGIADNSYETASDDGENENDEDFLTTTFTWRLRKVPKLLLNDEPNENCSEDESDVTERDRNAKQHVESGFVELNDMTRKNRNQNSVSNDDATGKNSPKEEKLGPLERAWPWADRTKIIYKQSTCHLVPRQPLGIVEKSKQLLAKQNLFDKIPRIGQKN